MLISSICNLFQLKPDFSLIMHINYTATRERWPKVTINYTICRHSLLNWLRNCLLLDQRNWNMCAENARNRKCSVFMSPALKRSKSLSCLSTPLFIYTTVYLPHCLSTPLFIYTPVYLHHCLSAPLFIYTPVYLPHCLWCHIIYLS